MKTSAEMLQEINRFLQQGITAATGLKVTKLDAHETLAEFVVTPALHQPAGIMNGGVSLLVAESVGSVAAIFVAGEGRKCLGLEINANHLEPVESGIVQVRARPLRVGPTVQVWEILFTRADGKLSCVARCTILVKK